MNIIICDDRKDDRNNLVNLLSEYAKKKNYDFNITEYASGEQLCESQSVLGVKELSMYISRTIRWRRLLKWTMEMVRK